MKFLLVYIACICFASLNLSNTASAVEIVYGSNFKKYIFSANEEGDFIKLHGENFRDGFGSPGSQYFYPGCLLKSMPVVAIGPARVRAELEFYSSQYLWLKNLSELYISTLFGFFINWNSENGTRETQFVKLPSSFD